MILEPLKILGKEDCIQILEENIELAAEKLGPSSETII